MKRYLRAIGVYVVLGGVTAGGVQLVRQNRALTHANRVLLQRATQPHAGLFVPSYPAVTLDGTPVTLGAVGHRQVVIFFRTSCPYCRASTPAFNALAERLAPDSTVAVYGVALDSVDTARAYAAEHGLRFPVIAELAPRLVGLYRVSSVPLILVLNEQGRMTYARLGVLDSAAVDSVVTATDARPPSRATAARQAATHVHKGAVAPY